jgi:hypothetical protein
MNHSSTSGVSPALRIDKGQHYVLGPNDELPYRLIRNLGQGGSANVEEVEDTYTSAVFARKVFKISGSQA